MSKELDSSAAAFVALVQKGMDAWTEAGRLLVDLVRADPMVRMKIMQRVPWITVEVLDGFEKIGRKEIYPFLLLDQSPGARRLIRLDYESQKRISTAEISVAVIRGGYITVETRKLQDLSRTEADRAIDDRGIRPMAEQRKLLQPIIKMRESARATKREPSLRFEASFEEAESKPDTELGNAQAAMLRARELIPVDDRRSHDQLTGIVTAIGKLRFSLKSP